VRGWASSRRRAWAPCGYPRQREDVLVQWREQLAAVDTVIPLRGGGAHAARREPRPSNAPRSRVVGSRRGPLAGPPACVEDGADVGVGRRSDRGLARRRWRDVESGRSKRTHRPVRRARPARPLARSRFTMSRSRPGVPSKFAFGAGSLRQLPAREPPDAHAVEGAGRRAAPPCADRPSPRRGLVAEWKIARRPSPVGGRRQGAAFANSSTTVSGSPRSVFQGLGVEDEDQRRAFRSVRGSRDRPGRFWPRRPCDEARVRTRSAPRPANTTSGSSHQQGALTGRSPVERRSLASRPEWFTTHTSSVAPRASRDPGSRPTARSRERQRPPSQPPTYRSEITTNKSDQ